MCHCSQQAGCHQPGPRRLQLVPPCCLQRHTRPISNNSRRCSSSSSRAAGSRLGSGTEEPSARPTTWLPSCCWGCATLCFSLSAFHCLLLSQAYRWGAKTLTDPISHCGREEPAFMRNTLSRHARLQVQPSRFQGLLQLGGLHACGAGEVAWRVCKRGAYSRCSSHSVTE